MLQKLLIVEATRYGQTAKIARRIAEVAREEGIAADVVPVTVPAIAFETYDAVLIAAPVFFGHHSRKAERFIRRNLAALALVRNGLISVSNAAGGSRAAAEEYVHDLVRRTGWLPGTFTTVAGADSFTKQGWLVRKIVLSEARKHGRDEDGKRDYEFTNWDEVERFAREFARAVAPVEKHPDPITAPPSPALCSGA